MDAGTIRRMQLAAAVRIAEALLDLATTAVQRNLSTLGAEIIRFLFLGLAHPDASEEDDALG